VAKTKYAFAKQQRELDKQQRKEEKVLQPPTHQAGLSSHTVWILAERMLVDEKFHR